MSDSPTLVLVHGLAIARQATAMFHGLEAALAAEGFRVRRTLVQGDGSLGELADRLWAQLSAIDGPLVLLCHSMGGLQARTFLLDETRARRLRAIATLGSPHAGTPLVYALAPVQRAYRDMTPAARRAWVARHGEEEARTALRLGVRCISGVASVARSPRYVRLAPTQLLLAASGLGPSDGLVPAASQRWGEHGFEVDLDHLECALVSDPSPSRAEAIGAWLKLARLAAGTRARADAPGTGAESARATIF